MIRILSVLFFITAYFGAAAGLFTASPRRPVAAAGFPFRPLSQQHSVARPSVILGAQQLNLLIPKLQGKRIALMVNQTSMVTSTTHLVDTLLSLHVNVVKIFAPEHGFRGKADAGEEVNDAVDTKTKLPLVSLYGNNKKPKPEQLSDVDIIIFDIQDVGTRFFTYISSLHYLMEACAENGKKVIILDRPNPNGSYVDGPVLDMSLKSFVGMHPIPIVHGLTIGELGQMVNGEGWLAAGVKCDLEVVPLKNYTHQDSYHIPVKPSPNLPTDHAIALYPSVCLFEGTIMSVGRGTQTPFEVIGNPDFTNLPYQFTPVSIDGMAKTPPFENKVCYGLDLRKEKPVNHISLKHLIDCYNQAPNKEKFFISYFETLAGTRLLREQIKQGLSEEQIRATWKKDLDQYQTIRKKYLLYR